MRTLLLLPLLLVSGSNLFANEGKLNLLIITVDDLNADSLGLYGSELGDTSPNIDQLARQGLRFNQAHVVVGNCFPSRNVMWSGLFPHNTGIEGFYPVRDPKHLHLSDLMQRGGYYTGIMHKVSHSTPYHPYPGWDSDLTIAPNGKGRDIKAAKSYADAMNQGISAARESDQPFCLMMNISDPHKPFYAMKNKGEIWDDPNVPSRVFTPDEVPIPGYLFDDPRVRLELAHYYSSVRRADDCVGAIIEALEDSGERENTIIMFLSDHGMPLPFAKTQVYHHSSATPLFFIIPGMTKPNTIDNEHLVSAVDLLPTLLELTDISNPGEMDGTSFVSHLRNQPGFEREFVVKEYNENSGHWRDPMRALQTHEFLYIFNPWSNGKRIMATATTGTLTYRRMAELAQTDPVIAARHEVYQHRTVEEFYDIANDPDCLTNLINEESHQSKADDLRAKLTQWMIDTGDPMLDVFRNRHDDDYRAKFIETEQAKADVRKAARRANRK